MARYIVPHVEYILNPLVLVKNRKTGVARPVEAGLGAMRLLDAAGRRVDVVTLYQTIFFTPSLITSFLDGEVVLVSVHPLPGRDVG
jgi:hypothetical protein